MNRRAFTLVELLVVISIIGLLSTIAIVSLNSARVKSRDTKRIADLKQISTAVELYINATGALPTDSLTPTGGWCTFIFNGSFPQFINDIAPYMPNVPADPKIPKQPGDYFFKNLDGLTKYALCARLENPTGNTYDYSLCSSGAVYNYCIYPNGQ